MVCTKSSNTSNTGEILLYQTADGLAKIEVTLVNETVWLTIDQMAALFQRNKSTISRHIKDAFESGELDPDSTVALFATIKKEGLRDVSHDIQYYKPPRRPIQDVDHPDAQLEFAEQPVY